MWITNKLVIFLHGLSFLIEIIYNKHSSQVVVPTHVASFSLSAQVKGQLPVSIGEPLVLKSSENINDEW